MASILKRGDTWRAAVVRSGKRASATFDTWAAADKWATATEAAIANGVEPVALKAAVSTTAAELFERYAEQVSPLKGGARWEKVRLKSLPAAFPIFHQPLVSLDAAALAEWRDQRLASVASSTVNRELTLISAVINHAIKEWRVPGLKTNPVHAIKRPRDPDPRTQRISWEQRALIVGELGWPGKKQPVGAEQWVAWTFLLALETAMRKGELLNLTWAHVHLEQQRVHLPKTKNGYARDVPLSKAAVALFRLLKPGAGPVIPVASGTFGTLFGRAKIAANLPELRFHDARREATTVMAAKLGDVLELSAVTGHRSLDTLRRVYYQPDATAIAKKLG